MYCEMYNNLIPVAFVLGFYVSIVVSRWWEQFQTIPWPDRMALFVTAMIHGHDERGRLMRRTIMRYLCLAQVMTLAAISSAVKKRFPTIDHMTEAGEYYSCFKVFCGQIIWTQVVILNLVELVINGNQGTFLIKRREKSTF